MSSNLFSYILKQNQWIKSDEISIDDVAVLVDTQRDIIWYYESERSTARTKFEARGLLTQLKEKYVPYKFKKIDNTSPQDVLNEIETLRKGRSGLKMEILGKKIHDFSSVLYSLNITAGLLQVLTVFFLALTLSWQESVNELSFLAYEVNYIEYVGYIDILSFLILVSFIVFCITSFFGLVTRLSNFSRVSIILAIVLYLALIYIRIGQLYLYFEIELPNLIIRADAFRFFLLGGEIILIIAVLISLSSSIHWFRKGE